MLQIAVCDDEILECCNMAKRIREIMEEMKTPCIIRQFQSGGELLQALESFDIIFLDIIMRGMDGMKTAQLFRRKASDKILIFVSSSREYVFEAYDAEAFQYLLKPVDGRKLKSVLQRAVLKTESRSREFIIVSRERQKSKLFLDDIYYFETKGRVVDAHGPAPFSLGYLWAAGKFCRKFLGASKKRELAFAFCAFSGYLLLDIAGRRYPEFHIFSLLLNLLFFMGLVMLLFQSDREKRILAAAMLIMAMRP